MSKQPRHDDADNDYRFLRIVDAMASLNQRVNLIGSVVEAGIPKRTKGTDCFCTLKIVDQSYPSSGLSVNIFGETFDQLPHVNSAGDIIQLSHVVMKCHDSQICAQFYKKFSSFAIYEGRDSSEFVPYQVSSKFHTREPDKKFIAGLREWIVDQEIKTASSVPLSSKEMKNGERFNLLCKVLHVWEVKEGEWMLFVWDGTDAPPVDNHPRLHDDRENPLPLQLESTPLSREVLCTFPNVGTVLRMFVEQGNEKLGLHVLKPGRWAHFNNIRCEVRAGLWCGVLMPFSKLIYLPDDHICVSQCQSSYHKRKKSNWGRMPLLSFPSPSHVTEIDYDGVPVTTLMRILCDPEVTAKFMCVVRVLATYPSHPEKFCASCGTYMLRLTLEDPTARLHAYLYGEDAVEFFGGYPSTERMIKMQNALLGVEEKPTNPPWVRCCIKSYYLDKRDVWGTRTYAIFGTKLRLDVPPFQETRLTLTTNK